MRAKVLICDDNPAISKSLMGYLEAEGMEVTAVFCGEDAVQEVESGSYSLVILDVMLPGMGGLDVCREIRKKHKMPIIMLSAKGEEIDRILGLELGADDYITKPFSPHEVAIKVRKFIARYDPQESEEEKEISAGNIRIFPDAYSVFVGSDRITLTAREFKLLCYLVNHIGKVKTRDQIVNSVWGLEFAGEPRIVDTLVKRVRKKLSLDEDNKTGVRITTVFGVGYKLEEIDI